MTDISKKRMQTNEVVPIAAIVPIGIDFDASARSPDLFDPAIMPKIEKTCCSVFCMQIQVLELEKEVQIHVFSSFNVLWQYITRN